MTLFTVFVSIAYLFAALWLLSCSRRRQACERERARLLKATRREHRFSSWVLDGDMTDD